MCWVGHKSLGCCPHEKNVEYSSQSLKLPPHLFPIYHTATHSRSALPNMKLASIAFTLMQVLAAPLVGAAAIPDAELSVTERDTVSSTSPGLEKRAPCAIHLGYDSWWRAGAHDRYRVWFNAEGSGPRAGFTTPYDMLNRYCTIAKGM